MELHLEVLPAAAVAAVVAARLPGPAVPPAVVEALHRRTDGHPLFLVQLVEALRRQGALVEEAGRWELPGGLAALDALVPESLRQLIEQQFDGLRAEQQRAAGGGQRGGAGLDGGGRGRGGGGGGGAGRGVVCGPGAPGPARAGGGRWWSGRTGQWAGAISFAMRCISR